MINFGQVKDITIPEGSVLKITDSNGTILWEKISYTIYDDEAHYLCAPMTGSWGNLLDTGVATSNHLQIFCVQKMDTSANIYWNKAWGTFASNAESKGIALQLQSASSGNSTLRYYLGGQTLDKTYSTLSTGNSYWRSNRKQFVRLNTSNRQLTYGNGQWSGASTSTFSSGNISATANVVLFAYSNNRTGDGWKIARFELTDTNTSTVLKDLYPCKRSDGVLGMYDKVNNEFIPVILKEGETSSTDGRQYFTIKDENDNVVETWGTN